MIDVKAYDPPAVLEGENKGLVEAIAERLWLKRTHYSRRGRTFTEQSEAVKTVWRDAAADALGLLLDIGFVGPAGQPRQDRFEGRSYAWMTDAHQWEIIDEQDGFVALVSEPTDLELLMAAPGMRAAIIALMAAIGEEHPARQMPEIIALAASLPDARNDQPQEG